MFTIEHLDALEILDSRGRPTVQAVCRLRGHPPVTASVPSGASTGAAEAHELRDQDPGRYRGLGCRRAVENIRSVIQPAVVGRAFSEQAALDERLIELDGTPDKSRLGANAVLAVSIAFARAAARADGIPLYAHFARMAGIEVRTLPRLTINLFSGGKHAGAQAAIQDVLLVPVAAPTIDDGLAMTFAVYQTAAELIARRYGMRLLRADEGGLAPDFPGSEAMLADAVEAMRLAGLQPGREIALAVDVASSHFFRGGCYHLGTTPLDSGAMVAELEGWARRYPIVSLEDGLAEDDWSHWPRLTERLGSRLLVLGDDFLCTNPDRLRRAIAARAATALLLKVNQIGTLTEALAACQLGRQAGWQVTISARSGETEDDWLADLAVGWAGDQIKIGSITQSERLAKYNRLLAIERETGLPVVDWPKAGP
ncbi:MAG: phosphopyruvate hydratase [Verrucomicrobiales bacterium]|nr:phosphopyruvate hydratase [Verrucomicrobiales bacterium]